MMNTSTGKKIERINRIKRWMGVILGLGMLVLSIGCQGHGQNKEKLRAPDEKALTQSQVTPEQAEEILAQVRVLIQKDKCDQAIQRLTVLIQKDPQNLEAYELRGIAQMRKGGFQIAVKDFERALAGIDIKRPGGKEEAVRIYYNIGTMLCTHGFFDRGIWSFQSALEILGEEDPEIYNNMGACYTSLGSFDEAEQWLNKALALRPNDAEVYVNLGINAYARKDYNKAEQRLLEAIEKDNLYFPAHFALARVYAAQKDKLGQLNSLKAYLKARPNAPDRTTVESMIEMLEMEIHGS